MTSVTITARNVNHALTSALFRLRHIGVTSGSRNGRVLRVPGPVLTEYTRPEERLLFAPVRDANHVFHLMETIWMLAGQNDVEWLLQFNSKFAQYAEEDGIQHGAYGYRWNWHFGTDQIAKVLDMLSEDVETRRAVIAMWDPRADLGANKKDLPCNTHIYFDVTYGDRLNMTVCCRSNDMIWGAYGANAVHFSMVHELIASELRMRMGSYFQLSNNMHLYTDFGQGSALLADPVTYDLYSEEILPIVPLLEDNESWLEFTEDCKYLLQGHTFPAHTQFFRKVVRPLHDAYLLRKEGKSYAAAVEKMPHCDWKRAFQKWCDRRDNDSK
jgi:hypothetical protein